MYLEMACKHVSTAINIQRGGGGVESGMITENYKQLFRGVSVPNSCLDH